MDVLELHRSERADQLVEVLGDQLASATGDPVRAHVVCVPTRGVERWITQSLSDRFGVCANVAFPFPGSLVAGVVAAATGVEPEEDPWAPDRAVWALIDLVDRRGGDPQLGPLTAHLDAATPAGEPRRRFAFLRHVAELFDRYGTYRPEMVRAWAAAPPAAGEPDAWQHHLWRLLRSQLAVPSPAERLTEAVAAVSAGRVELDLPDQLAVFGLTRLPAVHLEVLVALAAHRRVGLYLLHPSAPLWSALEDLAPAVAPGTRRRDDPTRLGPAHPLLRSWGHDARELQLVLAGHGVTGGRHYPVPVRPATSLLRALQDGVRSDRAPGADRVPLAPGDESVRIYACHGRTRQVEVLRDAILHRLAADPSLETRDVIVMCPDIETFAPLIQTVFGPAGPGTGPELRVRLADRSLRQTNPLLSVASRLLDLAGSRVTASEVLDLAARPPVALRFGFEPDDLAAIGTWVAGTGVHWGLDAGHRSRWGLGQVGEGTWAAGLDRLLFGVAVAGGSVVVADTVPYGDLPSSDVDLVGRLAELVDRVGRGVAALAGRQPLVSWAERLREATESVATVGPLDRWQLQELRDVLAAPAEEASTRAGVELSLEEVRAVLSNRLAGRPTRANFRTGDLTFCTLVPMRSVPHRVVALLGLDDGAFPRHPDADGDDLLARDPLIGEREVRAEDRQLLLDALLAATDHLIVTYSGRDHRTNRRRPPCAPVAELLDVIDATALDAGGPASRAVVVEPPLAAHDPVNFLPDRLGCRGPWSFDEVARAGALAETVRRPMPAWLEGPLADPAVTVVTVEELVRFAHHPVKQFLRQRLDIHLGERDDGVDDHIPLTLDELAKWAVGDRLLAAVMGGLPLDDAVRAEAARGFLPPEAIRRSPLEDIAGRIAELVAQVDRLGIEPGPGGSRLVEVPVASGITVSGSVPDVRGSTILQVVYSRLAAKHRLAAWVRFLALTADRPDEDIRAVSVGRGPAGPSVTAAWLDPVPGSPSERRAWAGGHLLRLVGLLKAGLRAPLPLPARTGAAWAEARRDGRDTRSAIEAATYQWEGDQLAPESADPEYAMVWPEGRRFADLLQERPGPDDTAGGWPAGETSRFGGYARLLWDPLLAHERLERR